LKSLLGQEQQTAAAKAALWSETDGTTEALFSKDSMWSGRPRPLPAVGDPEPVRFLKSLLGQEQQTAAAKAALRSETDGTT
jgi:hypothetical protein